MKTQKFIIIAAITCLLLGVGMAQAQTYDSVEKEGDTVTAIRGLQYGVYIYDVVFRTESAVQVYGYGGEAGQAEPDFTISQDASLAVLAVNRILRAEGASSVGEPGSVPSVEFNIAWNSSTGESDFDDDNRIVAVWLGRYDGSLPLAWKKSSARYNALDIQTWADFIKVDVVTGDGNLSPTAEANGRYTGTTLEEVAFDSRGSHDPGRGSIVAYEWDFGDGSSPSNEPNPSYTYPAPGAYIVTLTVTDDSDVPDSDFTIALITASERPVADPNGPYVGRIGDAVTFDSTGSSDPDGSIVSYEWDFGDDSAISIEENPSYIYTDPGAYIVKLTVTDDSGVSDSTRTTATIAFGTLPPLAEAGSPVVGVEGVEVKFDGRLSRALNMDGSIVAYDWDFGDGTSGIGETPSHTYAVANAYNVTLTVTDNEGKTDSDHTLATIAEQGGPLDCSLAVPSVPILWPPLRQFIGVDIEFLGIGGIPPTINIVSIFQDEPVFFRPDGFGVETAQARVRADRFPSEWFDGNGRVYTIRFTAVDIQGAICAGEVVVEVPIRSGVRAINEGPNFDSTIPGFDF